MGKNKIYLSIEQFQIIICVLNIVLTNYFLLPPNLFFISFFIFHTPFFIVRISTANTKKF